MGWRVLAPWRGAQLHGCGGWCKETTRWTHCLPGEGTVVGVSRIGQGRVQEGMCSFFLLQPSRVSNTSYWWNLTENQLAEEKYLQGPCSTITDQVQKDGLGAESPELNNQHACHGKSHSVLNRSKNFSFF